MSDNMIREGRLGKDFDKNVAAFTSSLDFDLNLFEYDILTDMAHLVMLTEQGIVDRKDAKKILQVLKNLHKNGPGGVEFDAEDEDIHMAIEGHLIEKLGDVGGRLHTARSRNDQVATDLRMKAREDMNHLSKALLTLLTSLLDVAKNHTGTVLPAYTHLQRAQPTTLAHHLLSYVGSLLRSFKRLNEAYKRVDLSPLGSAAVTTTSFPISRERTASLLGFEGLVENSMDAVSSRDYMIELASISSLISLDISRLSEELIIWSTSEFGFIEIDDNYASTSSIMPQKKNPDILEIVRARTGLVLGNLFSIMTMIRSLPQSYNRDLQELSPLFFKSMATLTSSLLVLSKVITTARINSGKMLKACEENFSTATELADLLVREGNLPFRTAHQIVGAIASKVVDENLEPDKINSKYLDNVADRFLGRKLDISNKEIKKALTPLLAVKAKKVLGGPAPEIVKDAIQDRLSEVSRYEKELNEREEGLKKSKTELLNQVDTILGG